MWDALAHKGVRRLWTGQILSSVGDEVYTIALIWSATELMGERAGYLSALQAGSIFIFSLFGGLFVDHRDHRHVMLAADVARGLLVLTIPFASLFGPPGLWVLVPVAVGVSSLYALFDPALKAFLPQLAPTREVLQTSNGLMELTSRIARVIGPSVVAVLGQFIPAVHFFTVDAMSFFASALAIKGLERERPDHAETRMGARDALLAGARLLSGDRVLRFAVLSGLFSGSAWLLMFPLGITLLVRERLPQEVGSLGYVIAAYGAGNLVSALVLTNLSCARPLRWLYGGRLFAGVGFVALAFAEGLPAIMLAGAVVAIGGPMTDLGYTNMIQKRVVGRAVARFFRFSLALSYGALLITYLASPWFIARLSIQTVTWACGVIILLAGLAGLARRESL